MSYKKHVPNDNYEDIINLPHHVSKKRPHMSLHDRAAQFAPFAALTGYGDAIDETGRFTSEKRKLTESEKSILDQQLIMLGARISDQPEITVTYFIPDLLKEGGAYERFTGHLKRIHEYKKLLIMAEGVEIPLEDILQIESDCLDDWLL